MSRLNPPTEPVYSVTDLTREIKGLLEHRFPVVRVRGEISNLRRQSSGHVYFSLKDANATLSCVCFRNDAGRIGIQLRDGLQIVGCGRITVYEPRGNYQVIFRTIEEDGVGRLQEAFLRLKRKLEAEGLFDRDRKRPLPTFPGTIGFVTSASGAALRDFVSILQRRRWGGRLVVIPARVQGNEAAPEIVRGIEQANARGLCDLLVVGRGGGSLEDLWPFNEEIVARAIAASAIPVISAVGHEIDFTLSDFAADHRAETPSAAAEWITSARQRHLERFQNAAARLADRLDLSLERFANRLSLARAHLKPHHPRNRLDQANLRLDELQGRLSQGLLGSMQQQRQALSMANTRFKALKPENQIRHTRESLRQLRLRLLNNSHQATLKRGYAILRNKAGKVLSDGNPLPGGAPFTVEMRDGKFAAHRD